MNCFGFLGIILIITGLSSAVFAVYAIMEMMK